MLMSLDPGIDISAVVICYNQEGTIEAAMQSVLDQTAIDRIREIIVVDDCSTDGTLARVQALAARNSFGPARIEVIARETNSGGCAAPRNDGIRAARGSHIALLDGDDTWEPEKIATQIAALEAFPETGLLFSDYIDVEADSGRQSPGRARHYSARDTGQLRRFFIEGGPVMPSCAVLSRAAIDAAGLFDVDMPFNEDAEYWLRVAAVAPIHHQARALVRKRVWYGSLGSAKYRLENLACKREITERMIRLRPELTPARAAREARIDYKAALHHFAVGERSAGRRTLRESLSRDPWFRKAWVALALSSVVPDPARVFRAARAIRRPVVLR
jgi:glycosyltransferase involved in cell wall biosynthesis